MAWNRISFGIYRKIRFSKFEKCNTLLCDSRQRDLKSMTRHDFENLRKLKLF